MCWCVAWWIFCRARMRSAVVAYWPEAMKSAKAGMYCWQFMLVDDGDGDDDVAVVVVAVALVVGVVVVDGGCDVVGGSVND